METARYQRSKEGYVIYVSAICFDYPMGQNEQRVFRDATVLEILEETGAKYVSWDEYNKWCRKYLNIQEEK